jgi:hypothetical protein
MAQIATGPIAPGGQAQVPVGIDAVTVFQFGAADKIVLIALRNVTTGDTLDVGSAGMGVLQTVDRAAIISVTSFVEIAATFTGTQVTMPSGLQNDAGYLLAWGSALG